MKRIEKLLWLLLILSLLTIPTRSPQAGERPQNREEEKTILVGRISHVEGRLLSYVPEEKEWIATVKDAPFGTNDTLYSEKDGRAEIIMPNNTWTRIDGNTQIQLILLNGDLTEVDVPSGVARFYNRGSDAFIKTTTPFGYVEGPAETSFDLYVSDDSVEVIALEGTVYFFHHTAGTRFEVIAGSVSIFSDSGKVTAGEGRGQSGWEAWNRGRDTLWAERMQLKVKSAEYLPPRLRDHAYLLEENGRWEKVYYDGAYCYLWRPLSVGVGWAPFTVGRWTVWHGENTWIPYEPFGYVTHHYGNWVFARGFWYWTPPVTRVRVYLGPPLLNIGFAWYPGRVAWIHFGVNLGWFPLAPHEPYYCYRRWGPRAVIVKNVRAANTNMSIHRYRHFKRAVIINRKNFHRVDGYRKFMVRNIRNTPIIKNYRVTPVLNNTILKNYKNIGPRHGLTNTALTQKTHRRISERIKQKQLVEKRTVGSKVKTIGRNITNNRPNRIIGKTRIKPKKVKDGFFPVHRSNRPVSKVRLEQREGKGRAELRAKDGRLPKAEISPKPVRRRALQPEGQMFRKSRVNERVKKILPRVERQVKRTQERKRTLEARRPQLRGPSRQGQQKRQGKIEKYQGREFAAPQRSARIRSLSGTAGHLSGRRHLNN
jgi:hypothetical protein